MRFVCSWGFIYVGVFLGCSMSCGIGLMLVLFCSSFLGVLRLGRCGMLSSRLSVFLSFFLGKMILLLLFSVLIYGSVFLELSDRWLSFLLMMISVKGEMLFLFGVIIRLI